MRIEVRVATIACEAGPMVKAEFGKSTPPPETGLAPMPTVRSFPHISDLNAKPPVASTYTLLSLSTSLRLRFGLRIEPRRIAEQG